ncbi:recombination protein RecR [Candidatus Curtissbacteria bacterium RIFCSPHIGHO2_02_FULL_40_17]|uniref:Recombination protein RecR n=4 Tax=Candidatus Curtissiibacteriota TaxID=1752717 RepID=A0A1F5GGA8_9BACT|nr:MAG: recombination protein RecR [Candidatus Curtissbacteria bacterium RIFCSPHIGHO2_02_FULL_40_17]OGE04868.1 MAG: recombination protein RecR [Candidatus Curtissbacteria bacterium RIFCSPHIGHO2_12_FULL_41_17]OGE06828.1 MAG: recombination protein RecR [Candidatus Curtissbacteria bacterium RIFCSPLOWO2_02_FULL_40_13b]
MKVPKSVASLIEAFETLPGIGPKTAARLTYYLLHAPDGVAQKLAEAAGEVKTKTKICAVCQNITEVDPCEVCEDPSRDQSIICVVEDPLDVWAIEKSGSFNGIYHVLHGVIAPLDNIGPEELKISELLKRLKGHEIRELIMATNPSMEGEATAMYIQRLIKPLGLKITRIARGIPIGAEIEYADEVTVRRALEGRKEY